MTKTIEIIPLAKKKAQKRGITEAQIREAVNFPDQVVEGYGGRKVAQKKYVLLDKRFLHSILDQPSSALLEERK